MKLVLPAGKLAYCASIMPDAFDYAHNYADIIHTSLLLYSILLPYSGKVLEGEIFGNFGKKQQLPKIYFLIFFVLIFRD